MLSCVDRDYMAVILDSDIVMGYRAEASPTALEKGHIQPGGNITSVIENE